MYRIIIADDEPLECLTFQQIILDYLGESCSINLVANGREAIESANNFQADIVFMDIEMPGINGLDATKIIRKTLPDCRIVFLTAYSEFEYVKQAIDIGAENYLLKPCAEAEIHSVLDRLISNIDALREEKKKQSMSMRTVKRLKKWLEEEIIINIIGGYVQPDRLNNTLLDLGINFKSGVCMIFRSPDINSSANLRRLFNNDWLGDLHLILCEYDDCLFVLAIDDFGNEAFKKVCSNINKILADKKTIIKKDIFCSIGSNFTHLSDAQKSFFHAHLQISKCVRENPFCIFEDSEQIRPDEFEILLARSLLSGDKAQAVKNTNELLDWLYTKHKDENMIIYELEIYLKRSLKLLKESSNQEPENFSLPVFEEGESKEIRTQKLSRFISDSASGFGNVQKDKLSYTRKMISNYINENYRQDIFLEQIAYDMNYSVAYFSKLFKQCFDKNFVNYLSEVRVEAAKILLKNPKINIKDVGAEVGYRDNNYFAKVFRRITGKSPSEYRETLLRYSD